VRDLADLRVSHAVRIAAADLVAYLNIHCDKP
jgi:hypothetical protein